MEKILQKLSAMFVILMFCMTSVAAADITLTNPTGGEYIPRDEGSVDITWERVDGGCGAGTDLVAIYYSDDGGLTSNLLSNFARVSTGKYTWDLTGLSDGNEYQILLHSECQSQDDVSDSFTLDSEAPVIDGAIITPTCDSEILAGGEQYEITWNSLAITDDNLGETPISLSYSVDGGSVLISSDEENDGYYLWTVPETLNEDEVTIILNVTDLAGHTTSEESCAFEVDSTAPEVEHIASSDYQINEGDDGTILDLDVYYYDEMDQAVEPTVTFSPEVASTLTGCDGDWVNAYWYRYLCTIDDGNEDALVDVTVTGAQDLASNVQDSYVESDFLWIDTIVPTAEIIPNPNPTNGDVEITLVFDEDMEQSFVNEPEVSISYLGDDSLYSSLGGNWENGYTWVESFDYLGGIYPGITLDVYAEDAIDLIGNHMEDARGTFVFDNAAPSQYEAYFDDDLIGGSDIYSTSFTYYYAETGINYYYTISDGDQTTEDVQGNGIVGSSSETVTGIDVSSLVDGTLTLNFWLVDEAGNSGDATTDTTIKDTTSESVVEIVTSEDETLDKTLTEADLVENGGSGFWVIVGYSGDMDTSYNPTITFDPSLEGVLSCPTSGWDYGNNYEVGCNFTVTDTDLELENIDVTVGNALDAYGNTVEGSTKTDAFHIDLLEPTVVDMDVTPKPAASGTVTMFLTLSEDMDTSVPMIVTVVTQEGTGTEYTVSGDFTGATTWEGSFYLDDYNEEGLAYVYISQGEDLAGNDMDEDIWSFAVDTVNFYILDIPGNDMGFTSSMPGFWLSINQLQATDLADYEVNTVLDATAGPLAERLTHADVSMVWAYDVDSETWASYNVDEGIGDFTNFGWTNSPAWYELELKSNGQYKSIRHDDLGETEEEPVETEEV